MDGTAGDAASVSTGTDPSRAAVADPAPPAVPAWVGRAVWRGIWQLIAAVLITVAALWFAGWASDPIRYLATRHQDLTEPDSPLEPLPSGGVQLRASSQSPPPR